MNRIINLTLLISLVINLSCATKKANNDRQQIKDLFLSYLEETFNEKDFTNEKMYIIIPCTGCKGCEQSVYSIFAQQYYNKTDVTLIICNLANKDYLPSSIIANNILLDQTSCMANYDFGYGYPTCFVVKNNSIIDQYTYSPSTIQATLACSPD